MTGRNELNDLEAALSEVRAIYAALAERPVDRNCVGRGECCHFKLTGLTPYLTKGEALLVAKALRASGRAHLPESVGGACPLLHPETKKCMVYEARPFGCRTHFCAAAGGPYSRKEVLDLIRRLEQLDAKLSGSGARAFITAVRSALDDLPSRHLSKRRIG